MQQYDPAMVSSRCCCCGDGALRPHCIIFHEFGSLLCDLPFLPLGLICLLSWRGVAVWKDFTAPTARASNRRAAAFVHFLLLFVDLLTLVPLVLTFCSVIRTYFLMRSIGVACTQRVKRPAAGPVAAPAVVVDRAAHAAAAAGAIAPSSPAPAPADAKAAGEGDALIAQAAAAAVVADDQFDEKFSVCCCGVADGNFYTAVWSEFMHLLLDLPLVPFALVRTLRTVHKPCLFCRR